VLQAGLLAVAVAAAVGGGVFEDGFSGLGVGDVGTTLAGDATAAAFTVEFSAAFPLFGAAVDGGLLRYFHYNDGAPKIEEVEQYLNSIGFELVAVICKNENDGDYHFKRSV
jgi:hypothetical protein